MNYALTKAIVTIKKSFEFLIQKIDVNYKVDTNIYYKKL